MRKLRTFIASVALGATLAACSQGSGAVGMAGSVVVASVAPPVVSFTTLPGKAYNRVSYVVAPTMAAAVKSPVLAP